MLRLAAGADVFVQNFRPGVGDRLGVGEEPVRAVSPKIVYVSISGFGEKGPYAEKPAYDPVIQGFTGLATVQAGSDEARPAAGAHHLAGQTDRDYRLAGDHRRVAGARAHR